MKNKFSFQQSESNSLVVFYTYDIQVFMHGYVKCLINIFHQSKHCKGLANLV